MGEHAAEPAHHAADVQHIAEGYTLSRSAAEDGGMVWKVVLRHDAENTRTGVQDSGQEA